MGPWFRRRRSEPGSELEGAAGRAELDAEAAVTDGEPEPGLPAAHGEPEPDPAAPDPAGSLSSERLDRALERLRRETPASSGEAPPE